LSREERNGGEVRKHSFPSEPSCPARDPRLRQTALHLRQSDAFGADLDFSSNQSNEDFGLYFQGFNPVFKERHASASLLH
jgi:hypothetical protein